MIRLTSLEVQISFLSITGESNKFQHYSFPDSENGGVSYEKVRDETEKDLEILDITATHLKDEIIGPKVIKEYTEQKSKRMRNYDYMGILALYVSSLFQDFEKFLRTEIDLVADDIRLVLDEYNSSFFICELGPGSYTFNYLSEALFKIL